MQVNKTQLAFVDVVLLCDCFCVCPNKSDRNGLDFASELMFVCLCQSMCVCVWMSVLSIESKLNA